MARKSKEAEVTKVYEIEGYPKYFVSQEKRVYHYAYGKHLKEVKLYFKGYSLGYVLDSKFITLKRFNELLKEIKN